MFTRRMGSSPIDRTILESGAVYRLFFFFSFGAEIFLADRFGWRLQIGAFLLFCLKIERRRGVMRAAGLFLLTMMFFSR